MDGIAIGCSPTSNALLVYNPRTTMYYKPDSYRLDPYWLPSLFHPQLKYDGGLFCSLLLRKNNPVMEEAYPPGTRVEPIDPATYMLLAGTVMDILLSLDSLGSPVYQNLLDNGTVALIPLAEMSSLIPISGNSSLLLSSGSDSSRLPPFLTVSSRITYKHDRTYLSGYLTQKECGT